MPHGDGRGVSTRGEGPRRLEGPVAVAEQHRDGVGPSVADRQIELAIAVEITERNGLRIETNPVERRRREGPVAVAQQH